jgi:hypothetical protein
MEIRVTEDFITLCEKILAAGKTAEEWAEVESDDMFQSTSFSGGFDADEMAFCFSYYDTQHDEFWFQLTMQEVADVVARRRHTIAVRAAD